MSPPLCPQGLPKEVVSVSNMGVSKRGPIIEGRDRLLLEFTDGSVCMSDGLQLKYTTRIHLVCSKGSQVSPADPGGLGGSELEPTAFRGSETVCVALCSPCTHGS